MPGHEVVGRVAGRGAGASRFREGDRVGVAWLHRACGACRFCAARRREPLHRAALHGLGRRRRLRRVRRRARGLRLRAARARRRAPASRRSCAPASSAGARTCGAASQPGERLGLYGFGGSAHIVIQIARHFGNEVYVVSRGERHQALARELGAAWVGDAGARPPVPLDGAILFAPAGEIVPAALAALDRGGVLAVAGIHLSAIPPLDYAGAPVPGARAAQRHREHARRRPAPARARAGDPAHDAHRAVSAGARGRCADRPEAGPHPRRGGARGGARVSSPPCAAPALIALLSPARAAAPPPRTPRPPAAGAELPHRLPPSAPRHRPRARHVRDRPLGLAARHARHLGAARRVPAGDGLRRRARHRGRAAAAAPRSASRSP